MTTSSTGATDTSLDDEVLLRRARSAENGEKFERLWQGSTAGYESHSEADMALCSLLAFWTGGNARQMDRLFRESGLMRPKWGEIHYADGATYDEKTSERAIATTSEYYDPTYRLQATHDRSAHSETGSGSIPKTTLLQQIDALERELRATLEEQALIEADLEEAHDRIDELEADLEAEQDDGWWFL